MSKAPLPGLGCLSASALVADSANAAAASSTMARIVGWSLFHAVKFSLAKIVAYTAHAAV